MNTVESLCSVKLYGFLLANSSLTGNVHNIGIFIHANSAHGWDSNKTYKNINGGKVGLNWMRENWPHEF